MTVARTRLWWWFGALLAVPAVLAGASLPWAGQPPTPAAEAVSALPAVPAPLPAQQPPATAPFALLQAQLAEVQAAQPIRFGADSAELSGPSADTVRRVAELLLADPTAPVVVEGHVAATPGGVEVGLQLSDQRAAVVAQALVAAGVLAHRIDTRGLGAERPLATVEESRRVEITVG